MKNLYHSLLTPFYKSLNSLFISDLTSSSDAIGFNLNHGWAHTSANSNLCEGLNYNMFVIKS